MICGNYELQQEYLTILQQTISRRLFELGVVSRLVESEAPRQGAVVKTEGFDQLNKIFVPGIVHSTSTGETERTLSLFAVEDGDNNSQAFGRIELGQLDETDTLFVFPEIDVQDAHAVHRVAQELLREKQEGVLPDLSSSLLEIDNPNTIIILIRPE